ncbi:putative F-box domain-containing protein [Helianthus annuus]|nr:putative F-box domain-containing protein [Helianthus annuus]
MSDYIPLEIQLEIMNRLPVKSLLRFRSVCKSWKFLIDSSHFIAGYSGQQQLLLVSFSEYLVEDDQHHMSIVDDDSFPKQRVSITFPSLVKKLKVPYTIGSSHGLLCLYDLEDTMNMAVIWNPSIRKAVAVSVPNMADDVYTVLGFGVCRETTDPKILKITRASVGIDTESVNPWQVEVFTLSTMAWKNPCGSNLLRRSIIFSESQAVVDGVIYWLAYDGFANLDEEDGTFTAYDLIISFDMTSEKFGEVNLPDSLVSCDCSMSQLRESLVVIEPYSKINPIEFYYHVWMMEDGVTKSFIKLYTIDHLPDVLIFRVRGFRKTGEALFEALSFPDSTNMLAAYEPYSKSISNIAINERYCSYSVYAYMETLLLL